MGLFSKKVDTSDAVEKITTSEGYLICKGVPLGRVGVQLYRESELPGVKGKNGVIQVHRTKDQIFDPSSLMSLVGKPLVNDHPDDFKITADNWSGKAKGIVLAAYKKKGDDQYFYGDIIVYDKHMQSIISAGKNNVSPGYRAHYAQTEDEAKRGVARQQELYYNHLAVCDVARGGSYCCIGDSWQLKIDASELDLLYSAMDQEALLDQKAQLETQDSEDAKHKLSLLNKYIVGDSTDEKESLMDKETMAQLLATMDSIAKGMSSLGEKVDKLATPEPIKEEKKEQEILPTADSDIVTDNDYAYVSMFLPNAPKVVTVHDKRAAVTIATQDSALEAIITPLLSGPVGTVPVVELNAALAVASAVRGQAVDQKNKLSGELPAMTQDSIPNLNKKYAEFWTAHKGGN